MSRDSAFVAIVTATLCLGLLAFGGTWTLSVLIAMLALVLLAAALRSRHGRLDLDALRAAEHENRVMQRDMMEAIERAHDADAAADREAKLREAGRRLLNAISKAESYGWTWTTGNAYLSLDEPGWDTASKAQAAHAAFAAALAEPEEAER